MNLLIKKKQVIGIFILVAGFFLIAKYYDVQNVKQAMHEPVVQTPVNSLNVSSDLIQQTSQRTKNPIENALSRITKKPFGIYITPQTSPVQPERFSGYHTGVDLETTPTEQQVDIDVRALCDGMLIEKRYASGYGGVAVESCTLNNQPVTVVYGHIRLSSVAAKVGDNLRAGDFLANLGAGYSSETNGERKHLHLGIHKGTRVVLSGYVPNKNQLNQWMDPAQFLQ